MSLVQARPVMINHHTSIVVHVYLSSIVVLHSSIVVLLPCVVVLLPWVCCITHKLPPQCISMTTWNQFLNQLASRACSSLCPSAAIWIPEVLHSWPWKCDITALRAKVCSLLLHLQLLGFHQEPQFCNYHPIEVDFYSRGGLKVQCELLYMFSWGVASFLKDKRGGLCLAQLCKNTG